MVTQKERRTGSENGIGARLKEIEGRLGGRTNAYKIAGVSGSTYDRWVHGKHAPKASALARLASAAGCSPQWLALGDGPKEAPVAADAQGLGHVDRRLMEEIYSVIRDMSARHGWMPDETARLSLAVLAYNLTRNEATSHDRLVAARALVGEWHRLSVGVGPDPDADVAALIARLSGTPPEPP
jgi:transcriptional regulator with XRE-family HTH domain